MKVFKKTILVVITTLFISYSATAQGIINAGFESVSNTSGTDLPDNWYNLSGFGVGSSTLSYSGTYSLAVWNWYFYAKGIAVNGTTTSFEPQKAGTPFSQKATSLTGYYYYENGITQSVNDTGVIAVLLKKYNTTSGVADTVGYGKLNVTPSASPGFIPFSISIDDRMPGINPDSVVIVLQSSLNGFCGNASDGNCLYLYVDDLSLETATGIFSVTEEKIHLLKAYPNPASDEIQLSWNEEAEELVIFSADGRIVHSASVNSIQSMNINTTSLDAGIYFVSLKNKGTILERKKIIIQK